MSAASFLPTKKEYHDDRFWHRSAGCPCVRMENATKIRSRRQEEGLRIRGRAHRVRVKLCFKIEGSFGQSLSVVRTRTLSCAALPFRVHVMTLFACSGPLRSPCRWGRSGCCLGKLSHSHHCPRNQENPTLPTKNHSRTSMHTLSQSVHRRITVPEILRQRLGWVDGGWWWSLSILAVPLVVVPGPEPELNQIHFDANTKPTHGAELPRPRCKTKTIDLPFSVRLLLTRISCYRNSERCATRRRDGRS